MPARWIEPRTFTPNVLTGTLLRRGRAYDGDTVGLTLDGGRQGHIPMRAPVTKVRLIGLDAPEHDQPHFEESKRRLARYLYMRPVVLETRGLDCFGRTLAYLFVQETPTRRFDINRQMVRLGYAWACGGDFRAEEDYARTHRIGLWRDPDPIPPWLFRKEHPECLRIKRVPTPWTGGVVPPPAGCGGG